MCSGPRLSTRATNDRHDNRAADGIGARSDVWSRHRPAQVGQDLPRLRKVAETCPRAGQSVRKRGVMMDANEVRADQTGDGSTPLPCEERHYARFLRKVLPGPESTLGA